MFFQAINQMITAGTDLSINIRRVNNNLTVAVVPRRSGVKDGERIVPLILNGTPEELDAGFLQAVGTPVQKAQGILTNLEAFEKQAEQAASQSKAARSAAEKESKEVREKREKMEKLLKKAEDAMTGKRYSEALTWLKQAKILALPDKQKEIDEKMAEVQKKASEGSLFGMEQPPMPKPQPAPQQTAPQYRSGEQIPMFLSEQPDPVPQPVCKYSINSLVYWVTYVHNVVYSFYRSMIYCYINSTQRCAGSIVIDIIPTNGADKRKFFPFAPYFPVTNVIKRYFYPYFPAIIGIKGYSFPYFPYLSGIMKIKTALYSLFSRLDWHKTVVFPCLGEIYEGIRSLSWEIPVT